jgi:signal transduction histidine kinase
MPIRSSNMTVGCVYIYEYDEKQGSLLLGIQSNLIKISYIMGAISVLLVIFFTRMMTGRIGKVLGAMEIVRKGGYGYKLDVTGHDELAELGNEFNRLTQRIKTNDEMRRRFVSDASHELKTPLAAIKLLSDSIVQNENMDTDTMREFVGDIGREADRLAKITEKLLNLTRLEVMTDVPVYRVDMKAVVERALQMLLPLAENSGVSLEYQLNDGCYVKATEDDLHQIVFNLIENAIKYTPTGGKIWIETENVGRRLKIDVGDTGIGIAPEMLPHIFEKFYRVKGTSSGFIEGTGLGLPLVKRIVERHGGDISVKSEHGKGSVFTVLLPLAE